METEAKTIGVGRPGSMVYTLMVVPKQTGQPTPLLEALNEFSRTGDAGPAIAALEGAGFVDTPSDKVYRPVAKRGMYMDFRGPDSRIITRRSRPGETPEYAEFALVTD
jgi:hypothetical protein